MDHNNQKSEARHYGRMPRIGDIVFYAVDETDSETIGHNRAEQLPAIVVRVWSENCVNLKILTDGPQDAWKTSVLRGREPGQWLS